MSERAAALATTFEQANDALIAAVEGCTDEQVRQICDAEGWSIAVAGHHVAASYGSLGGLAQLLAKGQELPAITMDMIHAANAQHAEEFASIGRDETLAELRTQGADAAALVRGLTDEQLDRSAPMAFASGASWSTADIIERILIGHPLDHAKSIQATIARPVTA